MKTMTKLFCLIALFCLSTVLIPVSAQKWVKYQEDACECQIKFPKTPEEEFEKDDNSASYDVKVWVGDQKLYLGYTIHTVPMIDPVNLSHVGLESFADALEGTIVREKSWEVNGYTGRQATINLTKDGRVCMYKTIFKDQIQFQLFSIGDLASFDADLANTYFDSFRLKK